MARSEAAYLRDTQALSQLSLALGKFASGVQEAIIQADAEIRRTQEWLQERAKYWHQQVVQARQEVQAAQHALHRCQSSVQYDRDGRPIRPDCSAEMAYLSACTRKLRQAEEELHTVKKWRDRIGRAISQYQNSVKGVREVATTTTKKGQSLLSRKTAEIEKYESIHSLSATAQPPEEPVETKETEGLRPRNYKYAGRVYSFRDRDPELHRKYPSGVRFDKEGYPDFSPYIYRDGQKKYEVVIDMRGDHYWDFKAANEKAGLEKKLEGYTWHHCQDGKTMQLVPDDLHNAVHHTGGVSCVKAVRTLFYRIVSASWALDHDS